MGGQICVMLNQKGGVGKSSTCHHIAGAFSAMGRRVLLVDNDPQSSLTQGFLGPTETRALEPSRTIAGLYSGEAFADDLAIPTGVPGVDLIPGSRWVKPFDSSQPASAEWSVQTALADGLAPFREQYDLILIDCPPNLYLCSWAALAASDFLLVPLKPEDYGAQGIIDVQESIDSVRAVINPNVRMLGFLLTLVTPRKTVHKIFENDLRAAYGELVFDAKVAESVDYVEALMARKTVQQYKPKGAAAKAMRALAEEFERRVAAAGSDTGSADLREKGAA
jgi:chromosome partitioning protein